jgi:hypothetical protein
MRAYNSRQGTIGGNTIFYCRHQKLSWRTFPSKLRSARTRPRSCQHPEAARRGQEAPWDREANYLLEYRWRQQLTIPALSLRSTDCSFSNSPSCVSRCNAHMQDNGFDVEEVHLTQVKHPLYDCSWRRRRRRRNGLRVHITDMYV